MSRETKTFGTPFTHRGGTYREVTVLDAYRQYSYYERQTPTGWVLQGRNLP